MQLDIVENFLLRSSSAFTAEIAGVNKNSSEDKRFGGLATIKSTTTGEKSSITFNSIDGVDTNSSDPNGLDAVAAAGSFNLSLPTTGTGSSISSTVYTKDIAIPTPENVAKAILKDIRSKGTVASLSGISQLLGVS